MKIDSHFHSRLCPLCEKPRGRWTDHSRCSKIMQHTMKPQKPRREVLTPQRQAYLSKTGVV